MDRQVIELIVSDVSTSLVAFLHSEALVDHSKKEIKRALEKKACRVNGKLETFASRKLQKGDRVAFNMGAMERQKVVVLHEDAHLMIIDKPPFWVVDPVEIEKKLRKKLGIVHRLDKETSGILVLAKSEEAKRGMEVLFKERRVAKEYMALVKGKVKEKKGEIDASIAIIEQKGNTKLMGVSTSAGAKSSLTRYEVVAEKAPFALVRCYPETGRTHQIRVHLDSIGLSICGDSTYGTAIQHAQRMMLHAVALKFEHPMTGKSVELVSKLPLDFVHAAAKVGIVV